jgi:peptidoglycan/LPS O-acetylase OafA/YrhL
MAHQGWFEANFAHFWSLSVEEQFYLCWPWLVLFLPRNCQTTAVIAIASFGPLYRLSYILSGYRNMTALSTYISTFSCLDNLGLGALLAVFIHRGYINPSLMHRMNRLLLPAALLGTAAIVWWANTNVRLIVHDPIQAVAFCCIICAASNGIGGPVGRLLEWKPLAYIGKISYGIYVYHPFMPLLSSLILIKTTGLTFPEQSLPVCTLAVLSTLSIASLSWHFMEKPVNDLKRYV